MGQTLGNAYDAVYKAALECFDKAKSNGRASIRGENSYEKTGYSKLFRQLCANQAPPCSLRKIGKELTGNMNRIHEEFRTQWEPVFNRLKSNPPNYNAFREQNVKYVNGTSAGDRLPNATQLQHAARASKGTASGIDGWLPAELALLPRAA